MGNISRAQTRPTAQLVILHLYATCYRCIGWILVIARYYTRHLGFAYSDTLLWLHYLFKTPHQHSRQFAHDNLYGETPLTTLEKIAKHSHLTSRDTVYEIGCGTGRTALWLTHFVHCRVVGIDHVPVFIRRVKRVAQWRHLDRVRFECADVLQIPLEGATCIYFYGTAREDAFVQALIARFVQLKPGTRIVTTSYPLSDYDSRFPLLHHFQGTFPWGRTTIYIQVFRPLEY